MLKKVTKPRKFVVHNTGKYKTRYGRAVSILTTNFKDVNYPIVAAVSKLYDEDQEILIQYSLDGRAREFQGRKHLVGFDLIDANQKLF